MNWLPTGTGLLDNENGVVESLSLKERMHVGLVQENCQMLTAIPEGQDNSHFVPRLAVLRPSINPALFILLWKASWWESSSSTWIIKDKSIQPTITNIIKINRSVESF